MATKSNEKSVDRGVIEALDSPAAQPGNGSAGEIQLTETQLLRVENFELKVNSLRQSLGAMQTEYQRYLDQLSEQHGLGPNQMLAIDPRTGTARPVDRNAQG